MAHVEACKAAKPQSSRAVEAEVWLEQKRDLNGPDLVRGLIEIVGPRDGDRIAFNQYNRARRQCDASIPDVILPILHLP